RDLIGAYALIFHGPAGVAGLTTDVTLPDKEKSARKDVIQLKYYRSLLIEHSDETLSLNELIRSQKRFFRLPSIYYNEKNFIVTPELRITEENVKLTLQNLKVLAMQDAFINKSISTNLIVNWCLSVTEELIENVRKVIDYVNFSNAEPLICYLLLKTRRTIKSTPPIEQKDVDPTNLQEISESSHLAKVNKPSPLCTLPPETFLQICKSLSPADLLSLSRTCKLFYNDLYCEDSLAIQEIWRQSRYSFMPYRKLVPPEGMSERQYVRFLLENKCHFCGRKRKSTKVYWERRVRCCAGCLETRMVLHCRWDMNGTRIYWKDQVIEKIKEIESLSQTDRLKWGEQQYKKYKQSERELNRRNIEDQSARRQQRYERKKAYKYNRPFTERSWKILKQKLVREYYELLDAEESETDFDIIYSEDNSDIFEDKN
ncbi:1049_t:CDS:2, partial [Scutellospora calospora]